MQNRGLYFTCDLLQFTTITIAFYNGWFVNNNVCFAIRKLNIMCFTCFTLYLYTYTANTYCNLQNRPLQITKPGVVNYKTSRCIL